MRFRGLRCLALLPMVLVMAGCGYVSEPLPPALRRPMQVTDLVAVERGAKIEIGFTVPKVTTEDLPIKGDPDFDLRLGVATGGPFEPAAFEKTSERITNITRRNERAVAELAVEKYAGKTIVLGLRVNGPNGRNAGWSNFVAVRVVPALGMPDALAATDGPDSVLLSWKGAAPEFRVYRKLVSEPSWLLAATVQSAAYTDAKIEYGKTYQYYVQAVQKAGEGYAESEISAPITVNPVDRFAPAAPTGLTAIPSVRSIELVWERNTEKDMASYSVYRNGEKVATALTAPAYSDAMARQGVTYQYQVTAVDMAGNESAKSAAAGAAIP